MTTIDLEPLTPDLVRELRPLIVANHAASGARGEALDPPWLALQDLDARNAMAVLVARVDGFAVGYLAQSMLRSQVSGSLAATIVAIYLDRGHRDLAARLLRRAEEIARGAGAESFTVIVEPGRKADWLRLVGYERTEVVLRKKLAG